ncbi:winged helix-turn-helix transcriptional regulator [Rhizorhapis sp. SPR117]|uniref:winged helix-turn-helix transcriptional regulator n=1 Tax=Rhizorhapis sp. SPR117 TaxID=2912611 RepID=UPI001F2AB87A|nr:helix-turn-helix transcriptional regulator [Rhizorhapis sp. SPR117]
MGLTEETCAFEGCSLPSALEAMGERWSFLILRAALSGVRHFEDFQSSLGIARNILASRLSRLVEKGILDRHQMENDRRKVEYRLTQKGLELLPVMLALRQWGERWGAGVPSTPVLADRRDRQPIAKIGIYSHDGRRLELEDLCWIEADEVSSLPQCADRSVRVG